MNYKKLGLIISLIFPIIFLLILIGSHHYGFFIKKEYTLNTFGYTPRPFLSGNYLAYRIDYQTPGLCPIPLLLTAESRDAYLCLDPRFFSYKKPTTEQCKAFLKGKCTLGRFHAGIERFPIPEKYVPTLDKMVRYKKSQIVISVTTSGKAVIEQLLVDGIPWEEAVTQEE